MHTLTHTRTLSHKHTCTHTHTHARTHTNAHKRTHTLSLLPCLFSVVHAGLVPDVPLHEQNPLHMLMIRNTRKATGLEAMLRQALGLPMWEAMQHMETTDGSRWWAETWDGPERVYYGHDARRKLQLRAHTTGLDCGCLYGFKLIAVCIQTGHLVSVPARHQYVVPSSPC